MWWLWAWSRSVAVSGALAGAPASHRRVEAPPPPPPRAEHTPSRTNADPPAPDGSEKVSLVDTDVLRALDERQGSFLRCFRIAQKNDLLLERAQVDLHVTVGATGAVDDATADGGPPALDACITAVARHLSFPAPEQPVEAEMKLYFQ